MIQSAVTTKPLWAIYGQALDAQLNPQGPVMPGAQGENAAGNKSCLQEREDDPYKGEPRTLSFFDDVQEV